MSDFKNSSAVHGSTLQEKDCDTYYVQKTKKQNNSTSLSQIPGYNPDCHI